MLWSLRKVDGMKIVTCLIIGLFLFAASSSGITEAEVDSATREVDRSLREQAEQEMETVPKKPVIRIAGDDEDADTDKEDTEVSGGCMGNA